jgi:YVTN family beta-propeller protein
VWVANEGADSLAVLDTATNAVSATVTGLKKPHNVQVGRDGGTVYAVSSTTNTVVAIDAAAYTVKAVASTGSGPAHVIEAPNGRVYVTDANDGTVSVYQGPELRPDGRIDLGGMPHGLRAAAGGSVIVVANTMAGALNVIDPATDRLSGTVAVGTGPAQVAVTANGRYAYAGITDPPSVVKVDVGARNVVGSVRVSASPVQLYLTPDESTVLSADQGSPENPGHTLSVMDTSTMTVRGAVGTGAGPHGVVVDNSGMRAWVTNAYDDTVSIVDIGSLSLVATVAVGAGPSGISYSSRPPATSSSATVTLDVPQPAGGQPTNEHEH